MIKNKILSKIKQYWFEICIVLLGIIIALVYAYNYFKPYEINKDFESVDLEGYNKLMIVAHPDDDILWGGIHLIEDDYLVVCVTCGENPIRVKEFISVMNATNDRYIMLGYPDKTNGERDNWDKHSSKISEDISKIISLKDWDLIVTHNPQGEYGHIHHKMTNKIVTANTKDKSKLYYFGKYHSKKTMSVYTSDMMYATYNDTSIKEKMQIIGLYKSQSFIQTSFDHMYEYEDWEPYINWEGVVIDEKTN